MKWVLDEFQDVHTRLEQLGRPVTFGMDPTVRLDHDGCHSPPAHSQAYQNQGTVKQNGKRREDMRDSTSPQLGVVT